MNKYVFEIWDLFPFIFVLFLILGIYSSKSRLSNKALYIFWILFAFAAIRYGIGYDYYSYVKLINHDTTDYSLERFEPLSAVLREIAHNTHYQVFFILGSFLSLYPVYKSCKLLSVNASLSLILYYLHPLLYLNSLCIVRNAIAFSLVLYAISLLLNEKKLLSLLIIIVALNFHRSAYVGFLIFIVYYLNSSKKFYLLFYIFSFCMSVVVYKALSSYSGEIGLLITAERYAERESEGGRTMTFLVNGLCLVNFLFWNKIANINKNNPFFLALYVMGTCIWNILLPINGTMASRLSVYFTQSIIFIAVNYKYVLGRKNELLLGRITIYFFLLLFSSYFFINIEGYLKDSVRMSNIPYQTIFYNQDYSNYIY